MIDVKSYLGGIMIKKTALAIAIAATSLGLVACGHSTTKDSHSVSSSSSNKVVKHSHKKKTQTAETSVSSSASTSQNRQPSPATTQTANQATAPSLASQTGSAITEDQARAMLGGANGDLQATRTSNGWTFSGDGYTATVGDDGSISHN